MAADPLQHHRNIRGYPVQIVSVRDARFPGEQILIPAHSVDPLGAALRIALPVCPDPLHQLVDGADAGDIRLIHSNANAQQMHVAVVQAGDHGPSAAVDHLRVARRRKNVCRRPHLTDNAVLAKGRLCKNARLYIKLSVDQCQLFHKDAPPA